MSEESVTVASVICTAKLIDRVQHSTDPNARELADRVAQAIEQPDRRVGAALLPKRRGGEPLSRTEKRLQRDAALRELAARISGSGIEEKARSIGSLLDRYAASGWRFEQGVSLGNETVRDLLRRVMQSGIAPPGRSQLKKIIRP